MPRMKNKTESPPCGVELKSGKCLQRENAVVHQLWSLYPYNVECDDGVVRSVHKYRPVDIKEGSQSFTNPVGSLEVAKLNKKNLKRIARRSGKSESDLRKMLSEMKRQGRKPKVRYIVKEK